MTITETADVTELGPCPSWCLKAEHNAHHDGDTSHGGSGRRVDLSADPVVPAQRAEVPQSLLINPWRSVESDACITFRVNEGPANHLTAKEARLLAADLLAAVDESEGKSEGLEFDEEFARTAHAEELQRFRFGQLRTVSVPDGSVVKTGIDTAFYCGDCGEWWEIPMCVRPHKEKAMHREVFHAGVAS
jgi:hypothetical protein